MTSVSSSPVALPTMLVCMVASAVANTVLRRIAMVPMEYYPFFMTLSQTLVQVVAFGTILVGRALYGRSMILSVLWPGNRLKSKHQQVGGASKE